MKRQVAALAGAMALALPAVSAETIGRTQFALPAGWELVQAFETKLVFAGGAYNMPLHNALYQLPGKGDTPRALLHVISTEGGFAGGQVQWISETCPAPRPHYFTNDFETAPLTRKRECLVVNTEFGPPNFYRPDGEAAQAMQQKGLKFFRAGYSLRSVMGTHGGTLLRVNLMTQRGFAGLAEAAPQAADLHGVPGPLVAWGEALHEAVRKSAYSTEGALLLPPISFTP